MFVCRYLQIVHHFIFLLLGVDQVLDRGNALWLLEHVFHQNREIISLPIRLFEFVRRAVAHRWVAKNGTCALLDVLMKLLLLFVEVESEARLLVLTLLQLSEVDAKVELLEFVLTSELDAVQGSWVVADLLLDRPMVLPNHVVALDDFV